MKSTLKKYIKIFTPALLLLFVPHTRGAGKGLSQEPASDIIPPGWFLEHRIQAHTRLSLKWREREIFHNAAREFSQMGVRIFTRHLKTGDEGAWWPSSVGEIDDFCRRYNCATALVRDAQNSGCRIIAYYRHMEDSAMAARHPDWMCVDESGHPQRTRRGVYLCFNSPYRQFVQTRLVELAQMGVDGFYFDETHMPKNGCWCQFCRDKFKTTYATAFPQKPDQNDTAYRRLIDLNNKTITETFQNWEKTLKAVNKDIALIIGSNRWPALTDRHMNGELFLYATSVKTEFELPARPGRRNEVIYPPVPVPKTIKLAMGYILARDAAQGRPAHVWIPGITSPKAARLACAGVLAFGNIANLDFPEADIPRPDFAPVFQMGDKFSRALSNTRPLKGIAILFSEHARDAYPDPEKAVQHVLKPMYETFETLQKHHYPVGFVTDATLKNGGLTGYRVLLVPDPIPLTREQQEIIQSFKQTGGVVIESMSGNTSLIKMLTENGYTPPYAVSGDGTFYSCAFENIQTGSILICLVNDFGVIQTAKVKRGKPVSLPAPCKGLVLTLHNYHATDVYEMLSEKPLQLQRQNGSTLLRIPDFNDLAVFKIEIQE